VRRLALTCGDPGGIGPEVALKAAERARARGLCEPVLVGPQSVWERTRQLTGSETRFEEIDVGVACPYGEASAAGGRTAIQAIDWAIAKAKVGEIVGVVTAPVSKTSLKLAGYDYPGQTEYFAEKCGGVKVAMMLAGPKLRVVLVSTHMALTRAIALLTPERIFETARIAHMSLLRPLGRTPRLALCALNPHAGEGGLFGDEETRVLVPAVSAARAAGIDLAGPFPADTLFVHAVRGDYDAVIVLFHDQGLIPLKLLHFDEGVNVTLGLPIVRTSPDHGTAFDIAGKGVAQATSMFAAMEQALC
jgi:4-hydroxythreonine-4-phosphate dehydrogenase